MSIRVAPKTEIVARSVPRQDGGWMIVTKKGASASSPVSIPEGARIIIRDGQVERSGL